MPEPDAPDPGAAYERTRLAWRRTVLALAVVALLSARLAVQHGVVGVVLAGAALAGWPALAAWAAVRMRVLAGHGPPRPDPGRLMWYAVGVAAYAVGGLGLVIGTLD